MDTTFVCSGIGCSFFGAAFSGFSCALVASNANALGSAGVKLQYEMDRIMGDYLMIPHYSLVEAAVLVSSAFGVLHCWKKDATSRLYTMCGLAGMTGYMAICAVWARCAKQWTGVQGYGTDPADVGKLQKVCGGFVVATVLATAVFHTRAAEREALNDRYIRIQEYCKENENFEWIPGNDCPEGFEDADKKTH